MKINVGIDLGTTYSAVSTFNKEKGTPQVLKNTLGADFTPSVVHIQNGKVTIGQDAKDLQAMGDQNTAAFYKTWMGDANFSMFIDGKTYTSEDLSGLYLKELVKDIEKANNVSIDGAVITVPAYFNEAQRQATINAGKKAGLKVLKIINEPTAAIIAYGLTGGADKKVMVYDLGGGTFDVTIAEVVGSTVSVLGTNGDHQLGGKDWDLVLINYLVDEFESEYDINVRDYPDDYRELQVECEETKTKLSQLQKATATVKCDGKVGRYEITREWFDESTSDLLSKTQLLIEECFRELGSEYNWQSMDEVVLVGGSTRMPQVRDLVTRMIGKPPVTSVNVDTIVSLGAAIQAVISTEKTVTLSLGKPTGPAQGNGAAQKRTLTLGVNSIQDVTSHSLGLLSVSEDGSRYVNTIIIPKNTHIPSTQSRPFKILSRNSKDMKIEAYILQGESETPSDNHILGQYSITNITPQDEKEIIVDISYTYDENGMVVIDAIQRKTGKKLTVTKLEATGDMSWMDEEPKQQSVALPTTIYLAIDVSGSMSGEPIKEVGKAANKLCDNIDLTSTKVGLVVFASHVYMACVPNHNGKEIRDCIRSAVDFEYNEKHSLGWGTTGPLGLMNSTITDKDLQEKQYIILLTDGAFANASEEIKNANTLRQRGVEIITIGIKGADAAFLKKLASSDENSMMANLNQLQTTFSNIAQAITEGSGNFRLGK